MKPLQASVLLSMPLLVLLGCRAAELPRGPLPAAAPLPGLDVAGLPKRFQEALGFDEFVPMDHPQAVQVGDRLLYRMQVQDGETTREWIALAVLGPKSSRTMTLSGNLGDDMLFERICPIWSLDVEVLDRQAGGVVASRLFVPEYGMYTNLYTSCEVSSQWYEDDLQTTPEPAEVEPLFLGLASVLAMFNGWKEDKTLGPILTEIAGRPGVGGMLRLALGSGITLSFEPEGFDLDVRALSDQRPAARAPARLHIGGDTVLRLELITVEPVAPLSIGMGIVSVRGMHPSNEQRSLQIELIGARRAGS